MSFSEVDILGVYLAPIAPLIVAAWLLLMPVRWVAERHRLLRFAAHPVLLEFAVYVIVLSSLVLFAAR